MPRLVGFDISFAIADIGRAAADCDPLVRDRRPGCTALVNGQLGDGNLHPITHVPGAIGQPAHAIETAVYGLVRRCGGAV